MSKYVFLYREKEANDRDCCAYVDANVMRFECGHYFGGLTLHGSCYSGHKFPKYDEIDTVLSKSEYEEMIKLSELIDGLGYGIEKGDSRYEAGLKYCKELQKIIYEAGLKYCKELQKIIDKLSTPEANEFFEKIVDEEIDYLMDEYNLSPEDISAILDKYYLDYRDRSVVACVFDDAYDCGYEEAWSCGYIDGKNEVQKRYFDFEKFGHDLADEEGYLELDDGRIVRLNY